MTTNNVLLLAAGPGFPEAAPSGYGLALFKLIIALLVVCALAFIVLALVRRHLSGLRRRGVLKVVDRYPLSPRQSLWVVEVGGRHFLIGAADGGISKLAELDDTEMAVPSESSADRRFSDLLGKLKGPR